MRASVCCRFSFLTLTLAINQSGDVKRVIVLQRLWKKIGRQVLVANRTQEAINRCATDGGSARIRGGRVWPSMDHCMAHFDSSGPAIGQDASCAAFKYR